MEDLWAHIQNLVERISGPMRFRIVLQPVIAALLAIRAGLKDARTGQPAYFWALVTNPGHRATMLKDGWKSLGRVVVLALVLDVAYQLFVLRAVYPVEALLVALILAIVPYLVLRGVVTRVARRTIHHDTRSPRLGGDVP